MVEDEYWPASLFLIKQIFSLLSAPAMLLRYQSCQIFNLLSRVKATVHYNASAGPKDPSSSDTARHSALFVLRSHCVVARFCEVIMKG